MKDTRLNADKSALSLFHPGLKDQGYQALMSSYRVRM